MVLNTALLNVAKYGFFGLTIICAGVLIATTTVMKHVKDFKGSSRNHSDKKFSKQRKSERAGSVEETVVLIWKNAPDDFAYNDLPLLPYQNSGSIFDRHISHCLTASTNPFCLKDPDQRKQFIQLKKKTNDSEEGNSNQTAPFLPTRPSKLLFGNFLREFCSFMLSLGVRSFLIEPSMIFCLMGPVAKLRLLKDGFVPGRTLGMRNVVTFGVMSEDAMTLDEDSAVGKALSAGFEVSRSRRWKGPWLQKDSKSTLHTTHYYFFRQNFMVHLVIFFEMGNYLWHSELSAEEGRNLLYKKESMYEKFSVLPFGDEILPGLRIPSDPQFFLLQIQSSRVLQPPRPETEARVEEDATQSQDMSDEQMRVRAFVAIEDLKNRLRPEGISFWMRSLSLLGWYLHGDIFSISNQLQVAAYFRRLNDSAIRNFFFNNDYLKMELRFGSPDQDFGYEFDCHGLKVNFLIAREDKNGLLSVRERGELTNRTIYPKFDLCSADVVGQKILVPCEPEEILKAEFGDRWRKMPSIKN